MMNKIIKTIIFLVSVILILSMMFTIQGCDKSGMEISEETTGETSEGTDSEIDNAGGEQNIKDTESDGKNSIDVSSQEDIDSDRQKTSTDSTAADDIDISELRLYFTQAMKYYEEESYLIAEFYLNKIKDSYPVLQDHIFYYIAKSLLSQEKYYQAEEYYLKLIKNYPDSIWAENANL